MRESEQQAQELDPAERMLDVLDRLIAQAHATWPVGGHAPDGWTAVLNDASGLRHDLAARNAVVERPDEDER